MTTPGSACLFSGNAAYLEDLYEAYLHDREAVDETWRSYFDALADKGEPAQAARRTALKDPGEGRAGPTRTASADKDKQVAVLQLINAYRFLGHRQSDLDPLGVADRTQITELEPEHHGLGRADLDTQFHTGSLRGPSHATLREILNALTTTYCGTIGSEYMHITDTAQKRWVQERLEPNHGTPDYSAARKGRILERLIAANGFENYLHRKYVGQKRFSLEGAESLIPLIDTLFERCSHHAIREAVVGMAHRGRLNVQINIFGKSTRALFQEFEGKLDLKNGSGDVKYHKGFSSDLQQEQGVLHAVLAFNPSHLEVINPVVEGSVRARQDRRQDRRRDRVLPVLIHGDAAFAGQGVVMETLNLSETRGYTTGGTVHIIVNNQIGFTTSDPLDSRSTLYCTDVAKMVQSPIFHVNANDPEAVVFVTELALDYRMRFHKDVVIDMICYRRHGHSEADEPSLTQPLMYQRIDDQPPVNELYHRQLMAENILDDGAAERMHKAYLDNLEQHKPVSKPVGQQADESSMVDFTPYLGTRWTEAAETTIDLERVRVLTDRLTELPGGFTPHRGLSKLLAARREMGAGQTPMDWGFAESLAYGSLLQDGYSVRLSGQDTVRGTFFHRHAAFHDQKTGRIHIPLQHVFEAQPKFLPINSLLSELAALGFDYGYSTAESEALVIWEAQFGDFANNAQVIIDQFISSSEAKWQRYCGLVMLLPHGYDGQGPEHSSARLERFLQLCAEENLQVCVPSTPAQMFHMLRRQMIRPYRKPLIVMSPKSLLRHKLSTSNLADLTSSGFANVIDEIDPLEPDEVTRLLVCSGKVYFDLLEARRREEIDDIAIVRIEQLYPFPGEAVRAVLARYANAREVVWTQEEPRNQGAWNYIQGRHHLGACLSEDQTLEYAGRPYSASPAVGYLHIHRQQQKALVEEALQLGSTSSRKPLRSVK